MTHDSINSRLHALYRFYDAAGALLYVGITLNPGTRLRDHSHDKPWWYDVARIELARYDSRTQVLEAERRAIATERPRYNIVHNHGRGRAVTRTVTVDATAMPDDCHDHCVPVGHLALYYPHRWHHGLAHYQCARGHAWTCWWGHDESGDAPEHLGNPAEVYS